MGPEHFFAMAFTACFLLLLLLITLRLRPGSPAYGRFGRGLLRISAALVGSLLGLWGVNGVTLPVACLFGGPGLAAILCLKTFF